MTGSGWTLVAGPQYSPPDITGVEALTAEASVLSLLRTTYFDTSDLRVLRWGAELRHEAGRGWAAVLCAGDHGARHVTCVHRFEDAPGPPADALDLLTAFTRRAPVRPVLRTRTERRELALVDRDGIVAGHVRDDLVTVMQGRRIATRFREIEVAAAPANRDGAALAAVVASLRAAGAVPAAPVATAVRAMGAAASGPPDVVVPPVTRQLSAADAIRRAIAASVTRLIVHDAAVREGSDPEGVHQARVATRRLRSDLRTFVPLLDADWVARLRDDLHGIADLLGAVRDADVLLGRLRGMTATLGVEDAAPAAPVLAALSATRDAARARLLEAVRGDGYVRLLDELVAAAANPPIAPEASGDAAALLPPLARGSWRRLRRRVRRLPEDPPDADLHQVRILAKRARYAAEAVAPVSRPAVAELAAAVAHIQEVLGDHHDAVVAEQWLRARRDENAVAGADFALGVLVGLERAAAAAARAAWPAAWTSARRVDPHSWS